MVSAFLWRVCTSRTHGVCCIGIHVQLYALASDMRRFSHEVRRGVAASSCTSAKHLAAAPGVEQRASVAIFKKQDAPEQQALDKVRSSWLVAATPSFY